MSDVCLMRVRYIPLIPDCGVSMCPYYLYPCAVHTTRAVPTHHCAPLHPANNLQTPSTQLFRDRFMNHGSHKA